MSQKQNDKLDKLYKELFDAQFYHEDADKEQEVLTRIRRLEKEIDGQMETYRESVRADGANLQ